MRIVPALLLIATLPATAQAQVPTPPPAPGNPDLPVSITVRPGTPVERQVADIRDAIRDGRKSGALSRQQARGLRREADILASSAHRIGRDGLSYSEDRELTMQGMALQSMVQGERSRAPLPSR